MRTTLRMTSKIATTTFAVAALMVMGTVGASASTTAPTVNAANTIAPGATGDVGATILNNVGTAGTGSVTLYLTAPSNSTFSSTDVWGSDFVQGVQSTNSYKAFTNCTLSNGNKDMTCNGAITIPAAGNNKYSGVKFTTPVTVNSAAPASTTFTDGVFNMTNSLGNTSGNDISGGKTNMQYMTPAVAAVPAVDPMVGLGAGVVIAGAGAAVALNRRRRAVAAI
ncbi:hypothetical protein GCM10023063_24280 [Arthrobacter methylotrophus]|uniref:Uncharacterized protein n=1 Tax=Arthrobacter methylotrophus TaxID=121291 RepID=A0ABV5UMH0_9MICC